MLVLLIIFMVAAPLATVDTAVNPPSSNARPQQRPNKPIYLTLKSDLSLAIGDNPVACERLATALDVGRPIFFCSSSEAARSLPPHLIDAFPHGVMPAHEVGAMAAIARADVDGFSVRGQRFRNGLMIGDTSRGRRRRGRDGLRRRRQRG